jgi:hypothetical protein
MDNIAPLPPPNFVERARKWFADNQVDRRIETWYPFVGACIAVLFPAIWQPTPDEFDGLVKDVLPVAVSVASVLAGFQAAGQAILLALIGSQSAVIRTLRETGHYKTLTDYLWGALLGLVVFIGLAVLVLSMRAFKSPCLNWSTTWTIVLTWVFVCALLASLRIMSLMMKLLRTAL